MLKYTQSSKSVLLHKNKAATYKVVHWNCNVQSWHNTSWVRSDQNKIWMSVTKLSTALLTTGYATLQKTVRKTLGCWHYECVVFQVQLSCQLGWIHYTGTTSQGNLPHFFSNMYQNLVQTLCPTIWHSSQQSKHQLLQGSIIKEFQTHNFQSFNLSMQI